MISVGRLDKNNQTLIKAVGLCNNPSIHLVICDDGEEKAKLEGLTKTLGLKSQIHLIGNRSDMRALYDMVDILVMASLREGLSRSVMEAMASGLPCVVSKIRGNDDLIRHNEGGFLCDSTNINSFASAISNLVENRGLRRKMKESNKEHIQNFDVYKVKKDIQSIYTSIVR